MINTLLHRQPATLDNELHRNLRAQVPVGSWSVAGGLNSIFLAAVEFGDACRDFPIVFVRAGTDPAGKQQVAPVAVFGLSNGENLFVQPDGAWRGSYMPAVLRMYPFALARIDDSNLAVTIDAAWQGLSEQQGERLFDDAGAPSELTKSVQGQLETLESEIQRTRVVGERFLDLGLFIEKRFDATLPDGQKFAVEGFLTIDEDKLKALPDATVLELQRNGLLGLIYAHLISLSNMRKLTEWRVLRMAAANGASPSA